MSDAAATTAATATPAGQQRRPSLLSTANAWIGDLPGLIGDRVELLALELRRAGVTLTQIVALGAVATLLGLTAWFALWGLVIGGLYALGMPWFGALLVVLIVNVAGAAWALLHARKIAPLLGLPATRRNLSFKTKTPPPPTTAMPSSSPPRTEPGAASHGPDHHAAPDPVAADFERRAA